MRCKYCDAERDTTPGGIEIWECGTHVSFCDGVTIQSGLCQKNELARYRAMFPVPPWSEEKITPEVCERLGMVRSRCESRTGDPVSWWRDPTGELSVRVAEDETWIAGFGYNKTAGQLACLVAARKAAVSSTLSPESPANSPQ